MEESLCKTYKYCQKSIVRPKNRTFAPLGVYIFSKISIMSLNTQPEYLKEKGVDGSTHKVAVDILEHLFYYFF